MKKIILSLALFSSLCFAGTPDQWRATGIPAANNATNINPTTNAAGIDVIFGSSVLGNKALVVQGKAGQTANLVEVQNSTGVSMISVSSVGAITSPAGVGTANATAINVLAGTSGTGASAGGAINVTGGPATSASGLGGTVTLTGGSSASSVGGGVVLTGGTATATNAAGPITISGGSNVATNGIGGAVSINGGIGGASGTGGALSLDAGSAGTGGAMSIARFNTESVIFGRAAKMISIVGPTTFTPTTTLSGVNVGSFAGDPSGLNNGDAWYNSSTGFLKIRSNGITTPVNPMTASGDTIYGGTSGVATRLAKGSDGQVLTLASGLPSWATAGSAAADTQIKAPVRVATTAAGTIGTSFENGDTVNGVVLATGDRILIKDQASQPENGIYTVNASGAPTRATDADTAAELPGGTMVTSLNGTDCKGVTFVGQFSASPIVVGTSNQTWIRINSGIYGPTANSTLAWGIDAGKAQSGGLGNIYIGESAGIAVTAQTGNVFIGYQTGSTNIGNSTLIGYQAGKITDGRATMVGYSAGLTNNSLDSTYVGYSAASGLTSGGGNTVVGSQTCATTSTVSGLAIFGFTAGNQLSGADNSIFGYAAGDTIQGGARNSLFGKDSGGAGANTQSDSAFFGYQTGLVNTGTGSTFVGSSSGRANTSGTGQTFVGFETGKLVTGSDNSIFGYDAGDAFTTGARNSLFGKDAGGAAGATSMSDVTHIGYQAGLVNTASNSTFVGSQAGKANTSGTQQTFIGKDAGLSTTGNGNTLLGYNAGGGTLTTGGSNVFLGNNADATASGSSNAIAIGSGATAGTNQFSAININEVYFGPGIVNATATAYSINGTGGSGTNNAGADVQLAGGKGTGTAEPGLTVLKYPLKTTTGTTLQSLSTQKFPVSTTAFSANTSSVTVTASVVNTTETTLLGSPSAGSTSVEGGLLRVGRVLKFSLGGSLTTSAVPVTFRVRIKLGSVTIMDGNVATPTATLTNSMFSAEFTTLVTTLGATGTCNTTGIFFYRDTNSGLPLILNQVNTGAVIDTTATNSLDVTITFGGNTAGNSITLVNCVCQILN